MPKIYWHPALKPRRGRVLRVVVVVRISTVHPDGRSLDDQENMLGTWLTERFDGPVEIIRIAGRGSGEEIFRPELEPLHELVKLKSIDVVLMEDLGRIYRRFQALIFCEACEDADIRVLALNDQLDTANDNWQTIGLFAARRHQAYNADTARRIRRTLRNRFSQGGIVQTLIYGFIKPRGAKTDSEEPPQQVASHEIPNQGSENPL